jgi:hypothetical protein
MRGAFQVLLGIGAVLVGEHAVGIDDGRWRVSAESAQVFIAEGECGGGQEVVELGHRAGADDRCADNLVSTRATKNSISSNGSTSDSRLDFGLRAADRLEHA